MIILDELPFRVVEGQGFLKYSNRLEPRFLVPSRWTVARDCMKVFAREKNIVKKIMKGRRICMTTDCWTSNQNLCYMCLTGHWIDDEWNLQKKILNFKQVPNHKGKTIGVEIELCLLEWGIDKIMTLTVDNASSNSVTVEYLKEKTKKWKSSILENDFLHVRCCAHILNLVVKDGLKEENESIMKIRNVVRYVRSSPPREEAFLKCVEKEKIESKSFLCLDVETRWNSTYLMLEAAVKFEKAFERLSEEDSKFKAYFDGKKVKGPPTEDDWKNARIFVKFLEIFYDTTLKFSGSLYVTANTFVHEIVDLHEWLNVELSSSDDFMSRMALKMKMKYDKYWGNYENINYLLYVTVVLDPRYKMQYIEFCLKTLYDNEKAGKMISNVEAALHRIFRFYETSVVDKCTSTTDVTEDVRDRDCATEGDEEEAEKKRFLREKRAKKWKEQLHVTSSIANKSELERYLIENIEETQKSEEFDILKWWKQNSRKYPCLSRMANEILVIPVSTVSSESAFSTSGRVLDAYRSSLAPKTVEALICSQNWLRTTQTTVDLRELLLDASKYEDIAKDLGDAMDID